MNKLIEKEPSLELIIPILKLLKGKGLVNDAEITDTANKATKLYRLHSAIAALSLEAVDYINGFDFDDVFLAAYFNEISVSRKEVEYQLTKEEANNE